MNKSNLSLVERLSTFVDQVPAPLQGELTAILSELRQAGSSEELKHRHFGPVLETDARSTTPAEDLTRKQIQLYLDAAGDYAKMLVDASLDAIISVDMMLRIVEFNPAAERVFGYTKDEVLGKSIEMLYAAPAEGWRVRVKTHDEGFRGEVRNRRKNGEEFTSLVRSIKLTNADGEVIGVMGISRDISQQRTLEEQNKQQMLALSMDNRELEEARAAADRANQAKSRFLANMSHEIRTPMTAVLGFTDVLEEACKDHAPALSAIEVIRRNGEHLLELLNDILDYSKLEAGRLEVEMRPCEPRQLIDGLATLLGPSAAKKGITIKSIVAQDVPKCLSTDPMRMRQILMNLVGNAIKFTEAGGVEIRTSVRPAASGGKQSIAIEVVDTGIGMTAEQVGCLFSPFVQADVSTSRRFGGTGLGLAISRRLARLLDGDIHVVSNPGVGSIFSLILPCVEQAAPSHAAMKRNIVRTDMPLAGRRILAVDDCADNQKLLQHFLTRFGADVILASNGMEALNRIDPSAKTARFDVILMDMQMPVMDGFEAGRQIRQRGWTGPIIALTANSSAKTRDRCLKSGLDACLSKPIDWDQLVTTIHEQIEARQQVASDIQTSITIPSSASLSYNLKTSGR